MSVPSTVITAWQVYTPLSEATVSLELMKSVDNDISALVSIYGIYICTSQIITNIVTMYTWTIEKVNVWLLAGVLFAIESLFALNRSLRQYKTSSDRQLASHLYWRQWGLVHKGSGHIWLMPSSVVFVIETDTETKMLLVSLISAILFNYRAINTKAEVKCSHYIM